MATLLGADGVSIEAKTTHHQFIRERKAQFELDRLEAVKEVDLDKWKTFVLRWADAVHVANVPPGGWENEALLHPIIHSIRMVVDGVPPLEQLKSAMWLEQRGHKLPNNLRIENGVLTNA